MLKKSFFFVCIGLLVFSCKPEVLDNMRLNVKGELRDGNGNPIPNIPVMTKASLYDLGNDLSDEQGRFDFVSLASDYRHFEIYINSSGWIDSTETNYNSDFSTVTYKFHESAFEQTYALSTVTLKKKALLNLKIEKTSTENDTLHWSLEYNSPICNFRIGYEGINDQDCYPVAVISDRLGISHLDYENQFQSVQNSEAVFGYRINSGEFQTVNIELNQDITNYVFEY